MRAQCIQECWHSTKCIKYTPEGGEDGFYDDIDPLDPIAQYFAFPPGTVKYMKFRGDKKAGKDPVETTVVEGGIAEEKKDEPEGPTKKELMAQLDKAGIKYAANMNKTELAALLDKE